MRLSTTLCKLYSETVRLRDVPAAAAFIMAAARHIEDGAFTPSDSIINAEETLGIAVGYARHISWVAR